MRSTSVKFYWIADPECPAQWTDLFEPRADVAPSVEGETKFDFEGQGTIAEIMRTFARGSFNVDQIVERHYPTFVIKKDIMREAFAFIKSHSPYVAVHIRRTDHTALAQSAGAYTSLEEFEAFAANQERVYLATDSRDIQLKYSSWLHYSAIPKTGSLRQTTLRHSLIDAIICSQATAFKGSGYSSFSTLIQRLKKVIKVNAI